MAKTANRRINIFLNGKAVEASIKDVKKQFRLLNNQIGDTKIGSEEYVKKSKEIARLSGIIKQHRNDIRGIQGSYKKVSGGLSKFLGIAGIAFGASEIIGYGKRVLDLGISMDTLNRKAQTVFGDALPQVTREAEKNATAMGLTSSQYTDAATAIADLLIPMGFQREESAAISTELVNLSGALSEWTGGQKSATEVSEILQKALLGEREQLKTLGISIQEADVKARLAEKGLDKLTGTMLQQAKAAATLELITEKTADAQTAFADGSGTAIRRQAELSAKFSEIQEKIATALLPVFERLLEALVPVVDAVSEAVDVLANGTEPVGTFAKIINFLGDAFIFAKDTIVGFYTAAVNVKDFITTEFQVAFLSAQLATQKFSNAMLGTINDIQNAIGIDGEKFELFDVAKIEAEIKSLRSLKKEVVEVNQAKTKKPSGGKTQEQIDAELKIKLNKEAELRRAANREKQAKEADQELKALEKKQEKLLESVKKFQEESRINDLTEDQQKIERLRLRYQKEIDKAKELEAKGITEATEQRKQLEILRDQEVGQLRDELLAARTEEEKTKAIESINAINEAKLEEEERIREEQLQIKAFLDESNLNDRQLELLKLEEEFNQVADLTSGNDDQLLELLQAYRQKKKAINDEFDKTDRAQYIAAQKAQAEALATSFNAAGNVISGVMNAIGDDAVKNTALGKALALAQIAFSSAEAIAKGTAAASGVPFPGNLVAIASTVATVLTNIGQARRIINSEKLPQKKKGGWLDARGQDDNVSYRAKYIGSPSSGMLPSHPVVLASEAGPEYFVSNKSLQNPYVLDHVRAIENITKMRQFRDGGSTDALPTTTTPPPSTTSESGEINTALASELSRLNNNLESGIMALIDDDSVVDIFKKFNQLNSSAGGALIQ